MATSKVYYTSFRTAGHGNLLQKLKKLIETAGIQQLPLDGKYAAIKMHFGEPGNMAYLRPGYAKVVVDELKSMGARPFLTDCNTLYVGKRRNALDHLDAAYENGFSPLQVGCQVLIADGLLGTDDVAVPIDGEYCKVAYIGRAAVDADAVISLSHFKGHEATGFGGALKNLGMGLGSCAGKRDMHHEGKPQVREEMCIGCGMCRRACAHDAIVIENRKARIDQDKCVGCERCVGACHKQGAITGPDSACDVLGCKIAEYALAAVKDKPHFHISLIMDVSPYCDCYGTNDTPIVADIGMFASFDPVALDVACADAVNHATALPNSLLTDKGVKTDDHFHDLHPVTNWRSTVEHAQKIGLGSMSYELIEVE